MGHGRDRVTLTPDEDNKRGFVRTPSRSGWSCPCRTRASPGRPCSAPARLAGMLPCEACGLRLTGYSTGSGFRCYTCHRRGKWGRAACPKGPCVSGPTAERDVLEWAEGLLEDPEALVRRMEGAIDKERALAGRQAC